MMLKKIINFREINEKQNIYYECLHEIAIWLVFEIYFYKSQIVFVNRQIK